MSLSEKIDDHLFDVFNKGLDPKNEDLILYLIYLELKQIRILISQIQHEDQN